MSSTSCHPWYYDKTNNDQVYFTYGTYLVDCSNMEVTLRLFNRLSLTGEPEFVTINGYPGITIQGGDRASVAWAIGDKKQGCQLQDV